MVIILFTFMPMSCAAPLSSETAIIALPVLLYLTKSESEIITTIDAARVTTVDTFMLIAPRLIFPRSGTETNFVADLKIICARL